MLKAKERGGHRDIYSYDGRRWIQIDCSIGFGNCDSPRNLPRGTKFDKRIYKNAVLDQYEHEAFTNSRYRPSW